MLYFNTVSPALKTALETIMDADVFAAFRLVGGTSLSLQLGHRMSDDIDLFTDAAYGSIDFKMIDSYLKEIFPYTEFSNIEPVGMGKSYAVGNSNREAVKLDVYYADTFIREALNVQGIRMATIEDVIAMKIDVIQRGGRKKDFWDLHELLDKYPLKQMLLLHAERHPYNHDADLILNNLKSFDKADNDFDPICLNGKYWEIIKLDLVEALNNHY
jgi:predicted nucleotidyltransferase component of viral defense system